ncbi:MAG: glycosyltransferase family 39 protein [Tannerella sp.]|jgi:4-amino-4-deoxy-L-arabinose transferase-like glycosyltransferase|nr:glycosyltransferase family 39 protein [Tannerella sp.]
MRTSALQYLYLQKPVSTVIFVCLISILPWAATNGFSTKGEPREAAVAVSMLKTGDWTLPKVYANEFAYKPPMMHWMIAVFSLPDGQVTEFTSRLPSILAYTAMLACVLLFFGRRVRFQEAFIATLLLLTCVEIHRAGLAARVDMLLTAFMVAGLLELYRWEDRMELKGLPVQIPVLLSGAILTKGPVGLIVPLFVFGTYLLALRRYRGRKIIKSLTYVTVSSVLIPSVWYIEAWLRGGNDFLNVALAENFGRFFHLESSNIHYELGHENGAWYNFVTLAAGFVPWTLLIFISLFGLKIARPDSPPRKWLSKCRDVIFAMDKVRLFSLVASVCIVFFYCLPSSKRSVYLMPAYPFIALFMSQYILHFVERRSMVMRVFAGVLATLVASVTVLAVLQQTGLMDMYGLVSPYITRASSLETLRAVALSLAPSAITLSVLALMLAALATLCYQMVKRNNIKILYSTIFVMFTINLFIDGVVMRKIHREGSSRPFAMEIRRRFPVDETNVYVVNNLRLYPNMYGLNFYMDNSFHDLDAEKPLSGYFLSAEKVFPAIIEKYADRYLFEELHVSDMIPEIRGRIVLSRFRAK